MFPIIKKQNGADWALDISRFLTEAERRHLVRITEKEKDNALKLNRKIPVKDWFLVCVALETGLRVQEIADLSCGDFYIDGNCSTVLVRNGKGGKKRPVLIREEFCSMAEEYFDWKRKQNESVEIEAPLFSVNGRHMTKRALQKSYKRSLGKAGISQGKGVGIHSLRHTYASFFLKACDFNVPFVQRQLGHVSMKTTETYLHVFNQDIKKALRRLYA